MLRSYWLVFVLFAWSSAFLAGVFWRNGASASGRVPDPPGLWETLVTGAQAGVFGTAVGLAAVAVTWAVMKAYRAAAGASGAR